MEGDDRLIGEIELSYRTTSQTYSVFDNGDDVKVVYRNRSRFQTRKAFTTLYLF